jgi:sarcosine oxidase subunit alpha
MSGKFRAPSGGLVNRACPINFRFDGRVLRGLAGDTLASALLANGVHLVGRSFKYHRPRGILSAGAEEPNALVRVMRGAGRDTPNLRATQIEIYEGLDAWSQNRFPSLRFDVGAVADHLAPLLPAGFYYKTFFGSPRLWRDLYEPLIRRAAGLGRAPVGADPDHYANRYAHCDVLVVGAGAAGLAAARAAAVSGARVILCDEQARMGGSLLAAPETAIEGFPAWAWVEETLKTLGGMERVTLLPRAQAFGCYADNFVGLVERVTDHLAAPDPDFPRERLWQVRAKQVVIAAGAIERPLVFADNDRPGVMLADAVRVYLARYGVRAGTDAAVFTAHDSAYRAALEMQAAGVRVALIGDVRARADGIWAQRARAAGIRVECATVPVGTRGALRVAAVQTGKIGADGGVTAGEMVAADLVLMSGGWTPSVHLFSQSRGKLRFDAGLAAYVPGEAVRNFFSAGGCRGVFALDAALEDGAAAGEQAARAAGFFPSVHARMATARMLEMTGGMLGACPTFRDSARIRAFVDFQNDVTAKDILLATREGFLGVEHAKRYTTTGMATDQGKTSNMHALAIVAAAAGKTIAETGFSTFRPPYTPVTFGALAGYSRDALFDPVRVTPVHAELEAAGAVFEDVGAWKRARFFPRPGEDMHAAVRRECRTVREHVGVFDSSTLGKIEVVGPDAAVFLDRIYVNALAGLPVGRCRYALMLTKAGFVMDDGIVSRLAPDRFHVTTTTGGAAGVLAHMEDYRQTEWPSLKIWLTSTTEQWAVIAVQGPKSRDVLAPLCDDILFSPDAFPHMEVRMGHLRGIPMRLFRVSFTGELGYEVNVPADYGADAWRLIHDAAHQQGGCAYGTETMHVLRAEKGFFIVGQETDGTVIPDDLGFSGLGRTKRDFVGKRSLALPDMLAAGRRQLVGLLTENPAVVLEEGAQITGMADPPPGTKALGHVTSAYGSETLGRSIALALLSDGRGRTGEKLFVPMPGGAVPVRVVLPVFFDPLGARMNG